MTLRSRFVIGLLGLAACSDRGSSGASSSAPAGGASSPAPIGKPAPPTATPRPTSGPSSGPSAPGSGSVAPPVLAPLPPIANVKQLLIVWHGSDPATEKDCGGIQSRVTVDLVDNGWIFANCEKGPDDPKGAASLKVKNGKLAPAQRSAVEALYAKVARRPSDTCGADGKPVVLTITSKDETSINLTDENWSCVKPPPELATGLHELSDGLARIVKPPT